MVKKRISGKKISKLSLFVLNLYLQWIAIRINKDFLFLKNSPYDMFVLLDAASAYILGFVFSKVVEEAPNEKNVENLF
ncbi:hypothetical protein [Desulfobacula phenolica]|uniref:Uncharacterized protein n=1 Tax=Desulfobacula phenolica TaxID=90732 RepID=A0A1H2JQV9_9BACT|nr:hypothetical protein [Desulfobacula phenolica]SDU58521.1 hypothetical protein SAMN04487931_11435 [Desulfobacula phenolica]